MSTNVLTIDNMIGQSFKYRGQIHKFLSHKTEDDVTIIVTDKKWFEFQSRDELGFFVSECNRVEEVISAEELKGKDRFDLSVPDAKSNDVMAQLKGILMENIKQVRDDKSYIPQAQNISKNVQTLINLTKLELQVKAKAD